MPFLISAEEAADRVYRSFEGNRFETVFPTRFGFVMKTLRLLPDRLLFAITRRMLR